jgi:hypothetical protein
MKTIFTFFLILCSSVLFAQEKYVCKAELKDFDRPGEYETKTYERSNDVFIRTNKYGVSTFQITEESKDFILLTLSTDTYPSIYVTFIDKKKKTFYEIYITPDSAPGKPLKGTYVIKK